MCICNAQMLSFVALPYRILEGAIRRAYVINSCGETDHL